MLQDQTLRLNKRAIRVGTSQRVWDGKTSHSDETTGTCKSSPGMKLCEKTSHSEGKKKSIYISIFGFASSKTSHCQSDGCCTGVFIDRRLCRVTGSVGVLWGGFFRLQKCDRASSNVSMLSLTASRLKMNKIAVTIDRFFIFRLITFVF